VIGQWIFIDQESSYPISQSPEAVVMNIPIYIDKNLLAAIGVDLIGMMLDQTKAKGGSVGLNWLIQSNISVDTSSTVGRDIRELLPERILYMVYPEVTNRFDTVEKFIERTTSSSPKSLLPGEAVLVKGTLSFPDMPAPSFDPFSPPDLTVRTFSVHGEKCFVGRLEGNGFKMPVYFLEEAKQQVCFCHQMPVEVLGIVRWSPAYSTGGARSLNYIVRAGALMLR